MCHTTGCVRDTTDETRPADTHAEDAKGEAKASPEPAAAAHSSEKKK